MIQSAGIVIFRPRGAEVEFLLLQASARKRHWTPPKGRLNEGEEARAAAERETMEEAGIPTTCLAFHPSFLHSLKYDTRKGPKETTYWLARPVPSPKVVLSSEHVGFGWFTVKEAACVYGEDGKGFLAMLKKAEAATADADI